MLTSNSQRNYVDFVKTQRDQVSDFTQVLNPNHFNFGLKFSSATNNFLTET